MRHFSFLGMVFAATALWAQAKPNVLLVTIDTLRRDHVGCYGARTGATPNLDALCRESARFDQAITASTITNTAHASIMTGLYPSRHGVTDFGVPLEAKHVTLAETLHAAGYQTGAFIGAVILDSKTLAPGFGRGFDHYEDFSAVPPNQTRWERVERRATAVAEKAAAWLTAKSTKPRFTWVHFYDPHDPYDPPAPYATRFKANPYDGEIAFADLALGQIITRLKRTGRYANTVILVMADHGEGLGEHGENTHGIFLYDSTLRVPLVLKPAGHAAPVIVGDQVSAVDVLPTLCELVGVKAPSSDGRSLVPLLRGKAATPVAVFAETEYPARFGWAPLKAVRTAGGKYIEAPRPETYDLQADPTELHDIYAPWNEETKALRATLAEFREATPPRRTAATAPVDPRTIEELKALGYLGNNPGATTAPEPSMLPDPKDRIEVQNLLHTAMMYQDSRDLMAAESAYARAAELEPASFFAQSQLGELRFEKRDFPGAVKPLAAAYALDPGGGNVAFLLGQTLEKTGDLRAAEHVLEAALRTMPAQYDARLALGRIYLARQENTKAADQFEAAALADERRPEAHVALAKLLLAAGRKAAARAHLQKAATADRNNAEVRALLLQAK